MTARQLRALRGAAASGTATVLAAVSHTLGGGAAPAPLLVLAMAALLTPPAVVLMGRRTSLPRLVATVLTSQAAFHLTFVALGAPVSRPASSPPSAHVHDLAAPSALGSSSSAAVLAGQAGAAMMAAHAVSALATIVLLRRGEHALRAIASWAVAVARRAADPAPVLPSAPPSLPAAAPASRASRLCHDARLQRGPPVSAAS
ncbi:hypothetical protein N8K70_11940 [Microbacterium betulae]|uniref:Uncharacterized protein n=1 Tax=Microbacterium betulae TaxID=2981139 RepID=A0AA97FID9_9MICO|nr:hypothetical protein [Microbacterium sp. AB]WOF22087.1 hypothetical protein N8K70_11940 [Microbacterium sp. AB]